MVVGPVWTAQGWWALWRFVDSVDGGYSEAVEKVRLGRFGTRYRISA